MNEPVRPRKEQERKQRTREQVLAAAQRVFARQGYHPTLISEIVAEAGVGQGTFYRYFTNKRQVFEVLFDRLVESLMGSFAPLSESMPSSLGAYHQASQAAAERVIAFLTEHREVAALFLREANTVDGEFEQRLQGVLAQFAELARFYLDHAIASGFARTCRADLVAQALVGMVVRMVSLHAHASSDELSLGALAREIVDFAFFGFSATGHRDFAAGAQTGASAGPKPKAPRARRSKQDVDLKQGKPA